MIELTPEQREAVARQDQSPPRALDPDATTICVLVREEVYERVKGILKEDDELLRGLSSHVMQVFGSAGWDDPEMDVYDDLDPRRPS